MAVMLKIADVLNCNAGDMMNFIKSEDASTDNLSLDLKRMTKSFLLDIKSLIITIGWFGIPPCDQRGDVRWEN